MHRIALVAALMLGFAAQDSWAGVVLFQRLTDTIQLSSPTTLGAAATFEARILFTPDYNNGHDLYREWVDSVEDKHLTVKPWEIAFGLHNVGPALITPTSINLNAWHHIAAVYDGASMSLYLDGKRISTGPASGLIANGNALPIFGGGKYESYWPVAGFLGYVDWFRMSNVARYGGASFAPPASQPSSDSNTVLLFYFDEAAGSTTATDQSSNHNNGTLGVGAEGATSPIFTSDPLAPLGGTLAFNPAGVGHINIVPYFSTQESNVTAINIVNTDTVHGKVLKVRFRGASNSDDVYDFQVFLSPSDAWTAGISRGSDGASMLMTTDRSCTLPANVNGSFITGRVRNRDVAETREGYIEILNMGDIVDTAGSKAALYAATKHGSAGAPTCASSVLTAITQENASSHMDPPSTGLLTNWTIINVSKIVAYSGAAAAIEARIPSTGDPGLGNVVFWDQRDTPVPTATAALYTADPLLVSGLIQAARYDFPDLSTPYTSAACTANCPTTQARELSDAFAAQTVAGEFYNVASVGAATDWVVGFPTRRYFAAVSYSGSAATPRYNSSALNIYFTASNTTMSPVRPYQLCQALGTTAVAFWDREERGSSRDDIVISPGTPTTLNLCGEVAVVGINNTGGAATSATFGSLTRADVGNGFVEGWGLLTTPSTDGLPMLINQFTRVNNTQTSVYYGLSYPARVLQKGRMAP